MEVSAVIVASGKSTRTNGIDKNFFKIKGNFVVEYSIEVFEAIDEIKEIILVLNDNNFKFGEDLVRKYKKLKLTKGGEFRAQSVKNGVEVSKFDYILVHDGARPLIKESLVKSILNELKNYECVIPVIPVRQTIKEVENGFVKKTLDRTKLFEVQTPEGFFKKTLLDLYSKVDISEEIFDESILFENVGLKVKAVTGLFENIKITTPFDIFLVEVLLTQWK